MRTLCIEVPASELALCFVGALHCTRFFVLCCVQLVVVRHFPQHRRTLTIVFFLKRNATQMQQLLDGLAALSSESLPSTSSSAPPLWTVRAVDVCGATLYFVMFAAIVANYLWRLRFNTILCKSLATVFYIVLPIFLLCKSSLVIPRIHIHTHA